jgi:hypothetical protein
MLPNLLRLLLLFLCAHGESHDLKAVGIGLPDWVPAKAGAPVNRSAESRRLAAELEKIKKEQPNLWTNAAVSFRI